MSHLPYYGEESAPPSKEYLARLAEARRQRAYRAEFVRQTGVESLAEIQMVLKRGPQQSIWVCLSAPVQARPTARNPSGVVLLTVPVRQKVAPRSKHMPHQGAQECARRRVEDALAIPPYLRRLKD